MRYEQLNLTTAKNLQLCNIELRSGNGIDYTKINGIELDIHQRSLLLNEKIQRFAGEATIVETETSYEYDNYTNGQHAGLVSRILGSSVAFREDSKFNSEFIYWGNVTIPAW
jgi:hypothetical protein